MNENLRTHTPPSQKAQGVPPTNPSDLDRTAAQGNALLAAGAELIATALSTDSDAYMKASLQHGGE